MPKGLKRAIGAVVLLVLFYCLLGFLILPGIGLRVANQQLAQYSTVPARLERIEFNPFSLELTLWGLHLGQDGQEQVRFRRLYANLELDSLWKRRLHLADVELDAPHTELLFAENGTLNLSRLFKLPPSEPAPAAEEPSQPFPLRIDRIRLAEGSLHFLDRRPSEPVEFVFDPMGFELHNLSTLPEDGAQMTLVATGPHGGKIDWKGDLSIVPFTSKGSLTVNGIPLKAWWPYVRDNAPLNLNNGILSLASDYRLDLSKDTQLLLDNASINLRDLDLSSPDGKPLAKLATLDVAQATLDLAKQEVVVGQIRSQGLEAWAAREKNGQLDWQKLFADFKPYKRPEEPTPQAQAAPEQTPAQGQTTDAAATDKAPANPPQAAPAEPAKAQQATTDKPAAPEQPEGKPSETAKPAPAVAAAQPVPADAKPAAAAEPAKPWHVLLRDTQLRGYKAHLADRAPAKPVNLEIGPLDLDLQNVDSSLTAPLQLKLKTGLGPRGMIEASGQITPSPVSGKLKVATRDIDLRVAQAYIDPFIRLELRSGLLASDLDVDLKGTEPLAFSVNGSAQVTQLHTLDTIKNRDFVKWTKLTLNGLAYKHGDSLVIQTVSLEEPYARFIINEDRSTNVSELIIPQPESGKGSSSASNSKPLGIRIGGVKINNGSANFADLTLRPDFATAIQQLGGEIGTIDNRNPAPASVDVKGKVDKYAPVTIKGSLNPFSPLEKLDIATSFKRVELTTLTPYSGKFAGYRIRKGRLNLDLHYQITQGKLKADNKVLVEHLQLGEKVDSPDAVDLPVKLAVALLKDANGNIDIQLPVEGDLNNPQFSVMPIVWQTLRNLVVRAVQAPFKFIAGLAGGGDEDLGSVVFAPGSSELDSAAQANLDKLVGALNQRPALKLEVEGVSAASSDGPPLAEKRLQEEYRKNYYSMLQRRGDKVPSDASKLEVPEDLQPVLLEGVYRTRLKKQPPAEWQELSKDERSAKMRQAVIDSWSDSQLLLRKLGQERATQIKDYLVTKGGLSDDRVYLIDVSLGEAENGGKVATQLHLDSE
ncbi:DUF748 domain-containing protein [Enterobacterales bacterium AE_CKDN230030158-1A_HGKHYDSX7]